MRLVEPKRFALPIKQRINRKSTGPDKIHSIILKDCSVTNSRLFSTLFTHWLLNAHLPKSKKVAQIAPTSKKCENPLLPDSYKPNSILSTSAKVFQRIIMSMIEEHCDRDNTIGHFQFVNFLLQISLSSSTLPVQLRTCNMPTQLAVRVNSYLNEVYLKLKLTKWKLALNPKKAKQSSLEEK